MQDQESVIIVLSLPSKWLHPNNPVGSKGSRMRKHACVKAYRKKACELTEEQQIETGPWQLVEETAHFFHDVKRRRDQANFLASLKPARDGIVDAGLVVDDDDEHWKTQTPTFAIDREQPRVEIEIRRIK